ncbi:hypothetical protein ACFV5K_29060, partial [Streptomyces sp. NPDC059744]
GGGGGGGRPSGAPAPGACLAAPPAGRVRGGAGRPHADSDVGQVAYEMTLMVKRVGVHLANAPRSSGLHAGG